MNRFLLSLCFTAFLSFPSFAEERALSPAVPPKAAPAIAAPDSAEMKIIRGHVPAPAEVPAALPGDTPEITALKAKAAAGDAAAQHELGVMYAEGQGSVERDYDEALKWHRMAADNANPESQQYLGYSYENGIGVTRSDVDAAAWYMKAAQQGHAASQGIIGNMYATGKGVDEDIEQAFIWLSLAQKGGDTYYESLLADLSGKVNKRHIKSINHCIREWKPIAGEASSIKKINFGD